VPPFWGWSQTFDLRPSPEPNARLPDESQVLLRSGESADAVLEHALRAGLPLDRVSEIALEISPAMFR